MRYRLPLPLLLVLSLLLLPASLAEAASVRTATLNFVSGNGEDAPSRLSKYASRIQLPSNFTQSGSASSWEGTHSVACPIKLLAYTRWAVRPGEPSASAAGRMARELIGSRQSAVSLRDGARRGAYAFSSPRASGRSAAALFFTPDARPNEYPGSAFHALITQTVIPPGPARRASCARARQTVASLQGNLVKRFRLQLRPGG